MGVGWPDVGLMSRIVVKDDDVVWGMSKAP